MRPREHKQRKGPIISRQYPTQDTGRKSIASLEVFSESFTSVTVGQIYSTQHSFIFF